MGVCTTPFFEEKKKLGDLLFLLDCWIQH